MKQGKLPKAGAEEVPARSKKIEVYSETAGYKQQNLRKQPHKKRHLFIKQYSLVIVDVLFFYSSILFG
ncbi:hypothetical protein A499_02280 [Niallia nealsonii AAU1]|nr:hypothetical protein A499_02280 [Niallia nealsonii AAU1]